MDAYAHLPEYQSNEDTSNTLTSSRFDEIDADIKEVEQDATLTVVEAEELTTDQKKSRITDDLVTSVIDKLKSKQLAAAAAAAPDTPTEVSGFASLTIQSRSRQTQLAQERRYQIIQQVQRMRERAIKANLKESEAFSVFIKQLSIGSVVTVGGCALAYTAVTFGFPALFYNFFVSGALQSPGWATFYVSYLELPFFFTPVQITQLSTSFKVLETMSKTNYEKLVELLTQKDLFSLLTKDSAKALDLVSNLEGISSADQQSIKDGCKALIDIAAITASNMFIPTEAKALLSSLQSILESKDLVSKLQMLSTVATKLSEAFRKLNFVIRTGQFLFDTKSEAKANALKKELLGLPFQAFTRSRFATMKLATALGDKMDIYLQIANKDAVDFLFLKVPKKDIYLLLSQVLQGSASSSITFVVDAAVGKAPIEKKITAAAADDDDSKDPIAMRRRALLKAGRKGQELVDILETEFPSLSKQNHAEELTNDLSIAKFMTSSIRELFQGIQASIGHNTTSSVISTLIVGGSGATAAILFGDPRVLTSTTIYNYLYRVVFPMLTAIQLVITQTVAKPYIEAIRSDIQKSFDEFIDRMGQLLKRCFAPLNVANSMRKFQKVHQAKQAIILNHFMEFLIQFTEFAQKIPTLLFDIFVVGGIKIGANQYMYSSSLSLLNSMRTMKLSNFIEMSSQATHWFQQTFTSREKALQNLFDYSRTAIQGQLANEAAKRQTVIYGVSAGSTVSKAPPQPTKTWDEYIRQKRQEIIEVALSMGTNISALAAQLVITSYGVIEGVPSSLTVDSKEKKGVLLQDDEFLFVSKDTAGDLETKINGRQLYIQWIFDCYLRGQDPTAPTSADLQRMDPTLTQAQADVQVLFITGELKNISSIEANLRGSFSTYLVDHKDDLALVPQDITDISLLPMKQLLTLVSDPHFSKLPLSTLETLSTESLKAAQSNLMAFLYPQSSASLVLSGIQGSQQTPEQKYLYQNCGIFVNAVDTTGLTTIDLATIDTYGSSMIPEEQKLHSLFGKKGSLRHTAELLQRYGQTIHVNLKVTDNNIPKLDNIEVSEYILFEWTGNFKSLLATKNIQLYDKLNSDDMASLDVYMSGKVGKFFQLFHTVFGQTLGYTQFGSISTLTPEEQQSTVDYLMTQNTEKDRDTIERTLLSNPDATRRFADYIKRKRQLANDKLLRDTNMLRNLTKIPGVMDLLNINELPQEVWLELAKSLPSSSSPLIFDAALAEKDPRGEIRKLLNASQFNDTDYVRTRGMLKKLLRMYDIPGGYRANWKEELTTPLNELKTILDDRIDTATNLQFPLLIENRIQKGLKFTFELLTLFQKGPCSQKQLSKTGDEKLEREYYDGFLGVFQNMDAGRITGLKGEFPVSFNNIYEQEVVAFFGKEKDLKTKTNDEIKDFIQKSCTKFTDFLLQQSDEYIRNNKAPFQEAISTSQQISLVNQGLALVQADRTLNFEQVLTGLGLDVSRLTDKAKQYKDVCKDLIELDDKQNSDIRALFGAESNPNIAAAMATGSGPAVRRPGVTQAPPPPTPAEQGAQGAQGAQAAPVQQQPTQTQAPTQASTQASAQKQTEELGINQALSQDVDQALSQIEAQQSALQQSLEQGLDVLSSLTSWLSRFGGPGKDTMTTGAGVAGPGAARQGQTSVEKVERDVDALQKCSQYKNDFMISGGKALWTSSTPQPKNFNMQLCVQSSLTPMLMNRVLDGLGNFSKSITLLCAAAGPVGILLKGVCGFIVDLLLNQTNPFLSVLSKRIETMRARSTQQAGKQFNPSVYFSMTTYTENGQKKTFTTQDKLYDMAVYMIASIYAGKFDTNTPLNNALYGNPNVKYNNGDYKIDNLNSTGQTLAAANVASEVLSATQTLTTLMWRILKSPITWDFPKKEEFADALNTLLGVIIGDVESSGPIAEVWYGDEDKSPIPKTINPYQMMRTILQDILRAELKAANPIYKNMKELKAAFVRQITETLCKEYFYKIINAIYDLVNRRPSSFKIAAKVDGQSVIKQLNSQKSDGNDIEYIDIISQLIDPKEDPTDYEFIINGTPLNKVFTKVLTQQIKEFDANDPTLSIEIKKIVKVAPAQQAPSTTSTVLQLDQPMMDKLEKWYKTARGKLFATYINKDGKTQLGFGIPQQYIDPTKQTTANGDTLVLMNVGKSDMENGVNKNVIDKANDKQPTSHIDIRLRPDCLPPVIKYKMNDPIEKPLDQYYEKLYTVNDWFIPQEDIYILKRDKQLADALHYDAEKYVKAYLGNEADHELQFALMFSSSSIHPDISVDATTNTISMPYDKNTPTFDIVNDNLIGYVGRQWEWLKRAFRY